MSVHERVLREVELSDRSFFNYKRLLEDLGKFQKERPGTLHLCFGRVTVFTVGVVPHVITLEKSNNHDLTLDFNVIMIL